MEKLPQELAYFIFTLLDHSSRLQCSLVSKLWKLIIDRSGILFETLQCRNDQQLEVAMRYFSNCARSSHRVKRIDINKIGNLSQHLLAQQALLFPELQHIELYFQPIGSMSYTPGSRKYATRPQRPITSIDFLNEELVNTLGKQPFWTKLKTISETSPLIYTSSILSGSPLPFRSLQSLWLNFALINSHYTNIAIQKLVNALENAPELQEIYLMFALVNREDLDKLHTSCPKLKSLALYKSTLDVFLDQSGELLGVLPVGHKPVSAPSVTKIAFLDANISHSLSLFSYISYKYPNLTDLSCKKQLHAVSSGTYRTDSHSALENLAFSCPHLVHIDTNIFPITSEVYKAFDTHCKHLQLSSFRLLANDLESKQSFDVVSNSRFRHTISQISIETVIYEWAEISKCLSQFTHLTCIVIEDKLEDREEDAFSVPLDLILSEHHHLETLRIKDCYVYRANSEACSSQVQNLSILNVTLNTDKNDSCQPTMDLISACCLKLRSLHINGDTYSSDHSLSLDLREHSQLATLDIYLWSFNKIHLQVENEPNKWLEIQLAGEEYTTERVESKRDIRSNKANFFDIKLSHAIPDFYQDEFQTRLYEENYMMYY